MKNLLLFIAFLALQAQSPALTTIVGTIFTSTGNPYSGSFTVQAQAKTNTGYAITGQPAQTVIVQGGAIQAFSLVPNDNSTPNLTSYRVQFANGDLWTCIVPTSAAPIPFTQACSPNATPPNQSTPISVSQLIPSTYDGWVLRTVNGIAAWSQGPSPTVQSFGAKGDGIADDTAAIQECLNSFGTLGGTCIFPSGVYNYTVLNVPKFVAIAATQVGAINTAGPQGPAGLNCTSTATGPRITLNGSNSVTGFLFSNQGLVQTYNQPLLYLAGGNVRIRDNFFRNYYIAILIGSYPSLAPLQVYIEDNLFAPGPGTHTFLAGSGAIDAENFGGTVQIHRNVMANSQPGCNVSSGCANMSFVIKLNAGVGINITDNNMTLHGPVLLITTPVGATLFDVRFFQNDLDTPGYICISGTTTCTGTALANGSVDIEAAGSVSHLRSTDNWYTSTISNNYGLYVNLAGTGQLTSAQFNHDLYASTNPSTGCWYFGGSGFFDQIHIDEGTVSNCTTVSTVTGSAVGKISVMNVGNYNPVGASSITSSCASLPCTVPSTLSASPSVIYIAGGTVSGVTLVTGGATVCTSSPCSVILPPNRQITIAGSVPPTTLTLDVQ